MSNPESPENIGLVARNMKNTGFPNLRLVLREDLNQRSYVTAVHSREILENAQLYSNIEEATADLDLVFASTSKKRKNFTSIPFEDAVRKMLSFPPSTKIGLLFGNERTGLTSKDLCRSNFCFTIPQATRQPSFNLASAVLVTLFQISIHKGIREIESSWEKPLVRRDQEECIRLILEKLENRGFIHETNKSHVTDMIHNLFGRAALTEKDRKLLLAIFSKGLN